MLHDTVYVNWITHTHISKKEARPSRIRGIISSPSGNSVW